MITQRKDGSDINQTKIIDQIRCLGIDMINEAKSGHPGIVLGAAPIIYTLYAHHLRFDPKNPKFYNRDRFVMSAGHGSALLYSTLYMSGFDLTLDDLKAFRQIDSKTPGHPEYNIDKRIECTTGPLGQGVATAVGMAMAAKYLDYITDEVYKAITILYNSFLTLASILDCLKTSLCLLISNESKLLLVCIFKYSFSL